MGGGEEIISTVLPSWYLWGFCRHWYLLHCKGRFWELFVAAGTVATRSDGIKVIQRPRPFGRSRKDFQEESRESSATPPPAWWRRESLRLPTSRFSAVMFPLFYGTRSEAAMGHELSLRTLSASRFNIGEWDRMVSGAVPLRCCSGGKIRKISVTATVIPALLRTFCSKKIHYDMFQSSNRVDDISLGSSVHFALDKDRMAYEWRADLHSGKRTVIYHESEQKWMHSLYLL